MTERRELLSLSRASSPLFVLGEPGKGRGGWGKTRDSRILVVLKNQIKHIKHMNMPASSKRGFLGCWGEKLEHLHFWRDMVNVNGCWIPGSLKLEDRSPSPEPGPRIRESRSSQQTSPRRSLHDPSPAFLWLERSEPSGGE